MRLLDQLLQRAADAIPEHLRDRAVVFGSAPMVFAGIKDDVKNDLDIFVADETFEALLALGFKSDEQKPGVPRIALADDVEVYKTWLGVGFSEVYASAAPQPGSHGLRVATLEHVLGFKLASKPREGPARHRPASPSAAEVDGALAQRSRRTSTT
jgi:hypothetical protein